jgi:iron(III) transport system permease protein
LSWWYFRVVQKTHRYAVITGRGYRPKLVELGPKQALLAWIFLLSYLFLSEGFPFLLVIWASLLPYFQPISLSAMQELSFDRFINLPWEVFLIGLKNTVLLVAVVPALLLVFCLAISWVVIRSGFKAAFIYDFVAFLPHPLPNLIFAVSAIFVALFLLPNFIPLYGTVWLLVIVYVVSKTSFGTRLFNNSLIQIHKELDEAAQVSGLSTIQVAMKILVPLLTPTMLYAWLWLALSTFRELSMAAILVTGNNLTLPVAVWGLWAGGSLGAAAAASLILVFLMAPLVILYWRFGRRRLNDREQGA